MPSNLCGKGANYNEGIFDVLVTFSHSNTDITFVFSASMPPMSNKTNMAWGVRDIVVYTVQLPAN